MRKIILALLLILGSFAPTWAQTEGSYSPPFGPTGDVFGQQSRNTVIKNNLWVLGVVGQNGFNLGNTTKTGVWSLPTPGSGQGYILTTAGNMNQQVAKSSIFAIPLNGSGTNGVLPVSSTLEFVIAPGRAGTITNLSAAAFTKPSGTGDVTVQFFKDSTSNAISGVYDLNSLSAGSSAIKEDGSTHCQCAF